MDMTSLIRLPSSQYILVCFLSIDNTSHSTKTTGIVNIWISILSGPMKLSYTNKDKFLWIFFAI